MTDDLKALLEAARHAHACGSDDEARDGYARVAALALKSGAPRQQAHALRHLSELDRAAGRVEQALDHAHRAAALYRGTDLVLDQANALRLKALALEDLDRRVEARTAWTEARELYDEAGVPVGVKECDYWLAGGPAFRSPRPRLR